MLRHTALVAKGIWPAAMDGEAPPEIQVYSDREIEAAAIVRWLSRAPASEPGPLEAEARAHFNDSPATASADKPAAEPQQADASGPVAASAVAIMSEVEDLGASSAMREFLRAHRREYKAAAAQAEQRLQRLAADWQTYTGSAIGRQRVKLPLSDSLNEPRCMVASPARRLAVHAIATQTADYDLFIASGLPNALVSTTLPKRPDRNQALIEAVRKDIVFAVFSRIAALSSGAEEETLVLRRAAAEGHPLASVLAKRLAAFESNRVRYPTLNDFLSQLLTGLRADQLDDTPALENAAANCGWLAPVSLATAELHGRSTPLTANHAAPLK